MGWWVEAVLGLAMVIIGLVTASARVLRGPAWLWGRRDAVTGAPPPDVRAAGTGSAALGGWVLVQAWWLLAGPDDPRVTAVATALGVCFLACSFGFDLWAVRLRGR
jgi:hypothetical protein